MTKFGISKGHNTPFNGGASGCGYVEDDCTRDIGDRVISKLRTLGYEVVDCTPGTATSLTDSLQRRCDIANSNNVDLYVEIHMNSFSDPEAKGTEVFCYSKNSVGKNYSQKVLNELLKIGWYNRGVKDGDWLYVIKHTDMTAILIETCFISNTNDMALYNPEGVANAIVMGLAGKLPETQPQPKPETKISIMGDNKCTVEQMTTFLLKTNPDAKLNGMNPLDFCKLYLDESNKLGIRGDIAFCQSIHETGWFKFGGQVLQEQNNYGGIGAVNNSPVGKGAWFKTQAEGIRALMQHLFAYASKNPLNEECVDPRFNLVTRGIAPSWVDLNGRWAVPGDTYGQSILSLYDNLCNTQIDENIINALRPKKYYVLTKYLPKEESGVELNSLFNKYFTGLDIECWYANNNAYGMWIETQYMTRENARTLADRLSADGLLYKLVEE